MYSSQYRGHKATNWLLVSLAISLFIFLGRSKASTSDHLVEETQDSVSGDREVGPSNELINQFGTIDLNQTQRKEFVACRFNYYQLPYNYIKLSAYHLIKRTNATKNDKIFNYDDRDNGEQQLYDENGRLENFSFEYFDHDSNQFELDKSKLNPELPFVFFINGFNSNGKIQESWMHQVARVIAKQKYAPGKNETSGQDVNVIFLSWHIPSLLASNILSIIPAYYKTIANYETVVNYVVESLINLIDFVEFKKGSKWRSNARERRAYFSKFRFYGHSLGAHIVSEAMNRVHDAKPDIKFGKLVGLDPADPCFISEQYGISTANMTKSTHQLVILHTNAGFAGVRGGRGPIEIVLNGGSFQPTCSWYDMGCHHSLATDIFTYVDNQCQMVAYKCSNYEQFKLGACETCDSPDVFNASSPYGESKQNNTCQSSSSGYRLDSDSDCDTTDSRDANCVLVNLEEQNTDATEMSIEHQLELNETRQLAEEDGAISTILPELDNLQESASSVYKSVSDMTEETEDQPFTIRDNSKTNQSMFNYVNTDPDYDKSKSHCLQHYQMRLIIMTNDSSAIPSGCPLGSYYSSGSGVRLQLFYNRESLSQPNSKDHQSGTTLHSNGFNSEEMRSEMLGLPAKKLTPIIGDKIQTSLINFSGGAKLFEGAIIENINLNRWARCLVQQSKRPDLQIRFILDLAFMSHAQARVRHAYSSILCGELNIKSSAGNLIVGGGSGWNLQDRNDLVLDLCRRSELSTISREIDKILNQVRFNNQYNPWHVTFLNSLVSLFNGWEPFRQDRPIR